MVSKQPNGRLRVCPISLAEAKEVLKCVKRLKDYSLPKPHSW
ncbi:hypothetical protein PO124_15215 [Bacillus licheniformis]|nr:hypothetical protein [Bacillus licheniformis]